jgi:hypothetical protein
MRPKAATLSRKLRIQAVRRNSITPLFMPASTHMGRLIRQHPVPARSITPLFMPAAACTRDA